MACCPPTKGSRSDGRNTAAVPSTPRPTTAACTTQVVKLRSLLRKKEDELAHLRQRLGAPPPHAPLEGRPGSSDEVESAVYANLDKLLRECADIDSLSAALRGAEILPDSMLDTMLPATTENLNKLQVPSSADSFAHAAVQQRVAHLCFGVRCSEHRRATQRICCSVGLTVCSRDCGLQRRARSMC